MDAYWEPSMAIEEERASRIAISQEMEKRGYPVTRLEVFDAWYGRPANGYAKPAEMKKEYKPKRNVRTKKTLKLYLETVWKENLPAVRDTIEKSNGNLQRVTFEEASAFLPPELSKELAEFGYVLDFPLTREQRRHLISAEGDRVEARRAEVDVGKSKSASVWRVQYWVAKKSTEKKKISEEPAEDVYKNSDIWKRDNK